MSYRVTFEVRYSRPEKQWMVRKRDVSGAVLVYTKTRIEAVKRAAAEARTLWKQRVLCEVVIYRKDGAIGKGHDSRMTYGKDPRRKKG
jgi:hypothetical protein